MHHFQIFSASPLLVFYFAYGFFTVQQLVNLSKFYLFVFAFISIALGNLLKETFLQFMSENVLHIFSSRSFYKIRVLSLNLFEFFFVHGVKEYSNSIDLHVAVQVSQHHLLKRLFLHSLFFLPLSKSDWV